MKVDEVTVPDAVLVVVPEGVGNAGKSNWRGTRAVGKPAAEELVVDPDKEELSVCVVVEVVVLVVVVLVVLAADVIEAEDDPGPRTGSWRGINPRGATGVATPEVDDGIVAVPVSVVVTMTVEVTKYGSVDVVEPFWRMCQVFLSLKIRV